jgi:hypothetical protein
LDNLPVINPLAWPEDMRQKIREWIHDFYYHQQASVLMAQIDELIGTLLAADAAGGSRPSLPIQLRLLETEDGDKAATD